MADQEEITRLKRTMRELELKIEKVDSTQQPTIAALYAQLAGIMDYIELIQEKEKNQRNPAMATRIKLARKGIYLVKEIAGFDARVESEFKSGKISEDNARKFSSIIKLVRINKLYEAREELNYFKEMTDLEKKYETTKDEIAGTEKNLKTEQLKIESMLKSMEEFEKETINQKKAGRYEELLKRMEELKKLRTRYISSLLLKSVTELIEEFSKPPLGEYQDILPETQNLTELKSFFSEYPALGKCTALQLCEYMNCSEKKLAHVCPEVSRFKKIVLEKRKMFETLASLEKTDFLAVDDDDEKAMNFYYENVDGASEIVKRIFELKKEKASDNEEYEKKARMEKRGKELEKYSKTALENQLRKSKSLLELLHSETASEEVAETKKEGKGLFSGINMLIRKISGK